MKTYVGVRLMGLIILIAIMAVSPARSAYDCLSKKEFSFGSRNQMEISLPAYEPNDELSVKRHYIFGKTLAYLLFRGLRQEFSEQCRVDMIAETFPDLRMTLRAGANVHTCLDEIVSKLVDWTPALPEVNAAIADLYQEALGIETSPHGLMAEAEITAKQALSMIYPDGSAERVVASTRSSDFLQATSEQFLDWLKKQKSGGLNQYTLCKSATETRLLTTRQNNRGKMALNVTFDVQSIVPSKRARLSTLVLIQVEDSDESRNADVRSQFCGKSVEVGSPAARISRQTSCLDLLLSRNDRWTAIFCRDCLADISAQVSNYIVEKLSDRNLKNRAGAGPYLIQLKHYETAEGWPK